MQRADSPVPVHGSGFSGYIGRAAALCLGGLALGCLLAGIAAIALRPPPIRTHEQQVAEALHRHTIAYEQIRIGERWPDKINFQYGANVFPYGYRIRIQLRGGRTLDGWLSCAQHEHNCTLSARDLGLHNVRLRDFTPERALPEWLELLLASVP
jgi:hypothetical protein